LTLAAPTPCDVETAYHCASVVADPLRPSGRTLRLDTLAHSYVDLEDPTYLEFDYVQAIASLADVMAPRGQPLDALYLGGGGLTLPRYLRHTRPNSSQLVLEVDGGVIEVDEQRLGLRTGEDLRVRVQDARLGLAEQASRSRDLVVGDAFGGLAVPWHLTTQETAQEVRRVLDAGGVYAMNVIDWPPNRFVRAEVATLRSVFAHVAILGTTEAVRGRDGGNFVLLASDRPLPLDAVRTVLARRETPYEIASRRAVKAFSGTAFVLTDDHAPVDQLITTTY
ncbi:MAG: fused MFS/spermidine synthase, partial [Streptomycetales bacterium]